MALETTDRKRFWRIVTGATLAFSIAVVLIGLGLSLPIYSIPSESGVPNVLKGDFILTRGSKFICGMVHPQPGDLVIFRHKNTSYLKRLVGSPGDRIQFNHGVLSVNGQPAPQKVESRTKLDLGGFQTSADIVRETLPNGRSYLIGLVDRQAPPENTAEYILPAGQYFFVGDSRDNSLDSRFAVENDGIGFVPAADLCAVALRVLYSPDQTHRWKAL